jgi:hypothetical protein
MSDRFDWRPEFLDYSTSASPMCGLLPHQHDADDALGEGDDDHAVDGVFTTLALVIARAVNVLG